jgi:hypothetical protein
MKFSSILGLLRARPLVPPPAAGWDLSAALLEWCAGESWSIRDAVEGTLILGATGSGKSSGSGRTLALAMLRAGFGGLVLTAKPDERSVWESYCRAAGRSKDLLIFGPDSPLRFNFLDHEMNRKGSGAGLTDNIVGLFSTVLEVAERNSAGGGGGREDEGYWRRANRQLCRNLVDLLALAKGRISIPDLYRLVISAPISREQIQSEAWKAESFCFRCLADAEQRPKSPRQAIDFELVADYFMVEFPALSEKTRSVIVSTFTSMVDVLNRGLLRDLFCGETNVSPEAVEGGSIILIDLPVKEFAEVGQFAQVLWKYAFQRSIERRPVAENPRPVFLWADEAQHFITSYDMHFQTTCRAARAATVLLSQNYSNFLAVLGGSERGRAEADSLLANLNTKIFHSNGDPVTNEWAAKAIGRTRQFMANGSTSYTPEAQQAASIGMPWLGGGGNVTGGFSEVYEYDVQPSVFSTLRTGGPANQWEVEGLVFQGGKMFRQNRKTWLPVRFKQR